MTRSHRTAFACCVAFAAAFSPIVSACAQPQPHSRVAPADEYFGPLQMSVLGIRNDLRDSLARLENAGPGQSESAFRHAALVERAIRDWEAKYPNDTWLPRSLGALRRIYLKAATDQAAARAGAVEAWLARSYPQSPETWALRSEAAADAAR